MLEHGLDLFVDLNIILLIRHLLLGTHPLQIGFQL